jgi:hypothetical protein
MSDHIVITPTEQRQLHVITRRLEQVEPVLTAINRATAHLPAADRLHVQRRLHHAMTGTPTELDAFSVLHASLDDEAHKP